MFSNDNIYKPTRIPILNCSWIPFRNVENRLPSEASSKDMGRMLHHFNINRNLKIHTSRKVLYLATLISLSKPNYLRKHAIFVKLTMGWFKRLCNQRSCQYQIPHEFKPFLKKLLDAQINLVTVNASNLRIYKCVWTWWGY